MADVKAPLKQWGQKLTEETISKIQELHETKEFGESYDELLRYLASLAYTKGIKAKVTALSPALDCIDEYTTRLRGHLSSAVDAIATDNEKAAEIIKSQKENFDNTLKNQYDEIEALKKQLSENDPETIKVERERAATELNQAQGEAAKLKAEIAALKNSHAAELKSAADHARKKAEEYADKVERHADKTEQLNKYIKELTAKLTETETERKDLAAENAKLKAGTTKKT